MSYVTNKDAAAILMKVAAILQEAGDNPYRVLAYRRAARLLLTSNEDVRRHLTPGLELDLPGLGRNLRRKLGRLLATGRMTFGIEVATALPPEIAHLMEIPGVGPKTAQRLFEQLDVRSAGDVYAAAQQGRIRTLYGFGPKREAQLLQGAEEVLAGRPKQPAALPTYEELDELLDELMPLAPDPEIVALPRQERHLPEAA